MCLLCYYVTKATRVGSDKEYRVVACTQPLDFFPSTAYVPLSTVTKDSWAESGVSPRHNWV